MVLNVPAWDCAAVAQKPWFSSIQPDKSMDLPEEPAFGPANSSSIAVFGWTELPPDVFKRFLRKIEVADIPRPEGVEGACWLWRAQTHPKGYGRFYLGFAGSRKVLAYSHRVSFEHFIAIPPVGYIVDHECNHKLCCNPAHLQPVSNQENLRLADERRPWKRRNQWSKE